MNVGWTSDRNLRCQDYRACDADVNAAEHLLTTMFPKRIHTLIKTTHTKILLFCIGVCVCVGALLTLRCVTSFWIWVPVYCGNEIDSNISTFLLAFRMLMSCMSLVFFCSYVNISAYQHQRRKIFAAFSSELSTRIQLWSLASGISYGKTNGPIQS